MIAQRNERFKEAGLFAHPQFFLARIARRGERWMRNPGGKEFSRGHPVFSAKEGGIEGLPKNFG
jgi:hypothetical protein